MKYILGLLLALCVTSAEAQSTVKVCVPTGNGNSCQEVTASFPLPTISALTASTQSIGSVTQGTTPWTTQVNGLSYANISAYTETAVKLTPGVFAGLTVNSVGTTSTATVYDNSACSGTVIGTFATTAQSAVAPINAAAATGICVTTAGSLTPANLTILYR